MKGNKNFLDFLLHNQVPNQIIKSFPKFTDFFDDLKLQTTENC